jgi:hypothetical protein
MKTPEEALAAARQRAELVRDPGDPGRKPNGPAPFGGAQAISLRDLAAWAVIEPDEAEVYSTRRLGAPITALKRLLIRLLRQYLAEVTGQQSRFNANLVAHLIGLEERVRELEEVAAAQLSGQTADPSDERRPR